MAGETEEVGARGVLVEEGQSRNLRAGVWSDCGFGREIGRTVVDSGNVVVGFEYTAADLENIGADSLTTVVDSGCTAAVCWKGHVGRLEEVDDLAAAELVGGGEVVAWTDSLEKEERMVVNWNWSRGAIGGEGKGSIACVVVELREAGQPGRFASVVVPLVEESVVHVYLFGFCVSVYARVSSEAESRGFYSRRKCIRIVTTVVGHGRRV